MLGACSILIENSHKLELGNAMNKHTMNHRELLATLSDEERLRLTKRSDIAGLWMLASHIAGLALTGFWIFSGATGWQLAMVLHGIQIVFLFTLLHETVHETPFRTRWLNTVVGLTCAFVVLLPPVWFRYFHLAHHRHTQDPELDPELQRARSDTLTGYLCEVTGLPVWWAHIRTLCANALGTHDYPYVPPSAYNRVTYEARIMLTAYAIIASCCFFFGFTGLLYLWIGPVLLGQPFLRLYLMAEHGRCPYVSNMLENSRTTYTTKLVRWLAWNMPYHAEHHTYPQVPFHKLPEFHEIAKDQIAILGNGYSGFHQDMLKELGSEKP